MQTTNYPTVDNILNEFVRDLQSTLGQQIMGVYFYGSLATGDFDEKLSDLDVLVVTTEAVDPKLVTKLDAMHTAFGEHNPEWGKRIDIAYISKEDLSSFKTTASNVAVSGNAEPLELVKAPQYYLIDWYKTQEHGVILFGPPPSTLIPHISKEEFTAAIRGYIALGWPDRVAEAKTHSAQAYIVLTMCRCLYALSRGQHASKKLGAQWVKTQYPQWHELIDNALSWSRKKETDEVSSTVSQEQTSQFVEFALLKAKD